VQTLSAGLAATFSPTRAALGLAVCYLHTGYLNDEFVRLPAYAASVLDVTGTTSTVAVKGLVETITLVGTGLAAGDTVLWVNSGDADACAAASTIAGYGGDVAVAGGGNTTWSFAEVTEGSHDGLARLCYSFAGEQPFLFSAVQLAVFDVLDTAQRFELLAGTQETIVLVGFGVKNNDVAYWALPEANGTCSGELALPQYGGLLAIENSRMRLTISEGVDELELCYRFRDEPFKRYPAVTATGYQLLPPLETSPGGTVDGPLFAVVGSAEQVTFGGFGVKAGDRAKWVNPGSTCDAAPSGHATEVFTLAFAMEALIFGGASRELRLIGAWQSFE
jgi:hypothetical protein